VDVSPVNLRDATQIERRISEFAGRPDGGLIILPNSLAIVRRELIIAVAARHRLPAIYPFRYFITGGGLISYGPDAADQYRRAADYVDRILKGDKPADLPVEQSTKVALTLNLKANGHHHPCARAGRRPCRHPGCIHGHASRSNHIGGGPKQRTGGLSPT
jgi:putative ABC transport system substrate-binding protein